MTPTPIDKRLSDIERLSRHEVLAKRKGNSDGNPPSGLDARLAKVEAHVEHIQTDIAEIKTDLKDLRKTDIAGLRKTDDSNFRILFAAIIFVALGLAGLMAKGFDWI